LTGLNAESEAVGRLSVIGNSQLLVSPPRCALDLFHGKRGENQVGVLGKESERLSFIQREAKHLFLPGKSFAELGHEILFGSLDFGNQFSAITETKTGERALIRGEVFRTIQFHMF
jgi:hypothetical protein